LEERLTEEQCWELFQRLFPNGIDDPSLVQKLAPKGWGQSPLALVYLGSFRAAAGFIANFRHRLRHSEARLNERREYIEFYLGTWMVRHRADLTPVYELIFHRMQQLGLDWRYVHPRLMLVDFRPLHEALESENVPEAVRYDPTENYWRERREAACNAEAADPRRSLDEAYRESVEETQHDTPPATVRAYQQVYGRFPAGWPPEAESENSS
jgi:hypothetical protein